MRFEGIVARMEPLLEQLQNSLPYNAPTYKGLPEKGIYVFFERGAPMYIRWTPSVGQHWGNVISEGPAVFPRYTNALLAGHLLSFDCSSDCTESPLNTSAGVR